jgi:hypothetical protein
VEQEGDHRVEILSGSAPTDQRLAAGRGFGEGQAVNFVAFRGSRHETGGRISWPLPRKSAGHGRRPGPYWARYYLGMQRLRSTRSVQFSLIVCLRDAENVTGEGDQPHHYERHHTEKRIANLCLRIFARECRKDDRCPGDEHEGVNAEQTSATANRCKGCPKCSLDDIDLMRGQRLGRVLLPYDAPGQTKLMGTRSARFQVLPSA